MAHNNIYGIVRTKRETQMDIDKSLVLNQNGAKF